MAGLKGPRQEGRKRNLKENLVVLVRNKGCSNMPGQRAAEAGMIKEQNHQNLESTDRRNEHEGGA